MKPMEVSLLSTEREARPALPEIEFAGLKAQYARLKPEIDARIQAVLDHGQFIMGPEVAELERALASFADCADAVAVSSGTDALIMALMAEGVGPGDAVFLPAFTFTATAEVVVLLGAAPVFVDVDQGTFNIDPSDLEQRIRSVRNQGTLTPRAAIAVDLFGLPADYPALEQICRDHNLFLLDDAAQSFGARLNGKPVGQLAPATAVSFFPAKPLGCYGDGGALLTNDPARAEIYRSIRAHGKGTAKYDIVRIGLNARLDTLQAAILLAKLTVFPDELAAREALARQYDAQLGDGVTTPARAPGAQSAWAQYTIQVDNRDQVADALKAQGMPTAVYYPRALHLQPAYERYGDGNGSLPVSEQLCGRVLSLPMHGYMREDVAERIADSVRAAILG